MKKINQWMHQNILKVIAWYLVAQPVIDVLTNLIPTDSNFSISMIIRFGFLAFFLYYFIVVCKSKFKQGSLALLGIIGLYIALFIIHLTGSNLFYEIQNVIKTFYFPTLFICLFNIGYEKKDLIKRDDLTLMLGIYTLIIVVAEITHTAYSSYAVTKVGHVGWFKTANEVGAILAIILPVLFSEVIAHRRPSQVILLVITVVAILIMGTKTPLLSLAICFILFVIKGMQILKQKKKYRLLAGAIGACVALVIAFIILIPLTPIYQNTLVHSEYLKIDSIQELFKNPKIWDHFFLGERGKFLTQTFELYQQAPLLDKLLGIGYDVPRKMIEMDFFDLLLRQGIVGFVIYFITPIYLMVSSHTKKDKTYLVSVVMGVVIAFVVGHVFLAPAVSFIMAILLLKWNQKGAQYE